MYIRNVYIFWYQKVSDIKKLSFFFRNWFSDIKIKIWYKKYEKIFSYIRNQCVISEINFDIRKSRHFLISENNLWFHKLILISESQFLVSDNDFLISAVLSCEVISPRWPIHISIDKSWETVWDFVLDMRSYFICFQMEEKVGIWHMWQWPKSLSCYHQNFHYVARELKKKDLYTHCE